MLNAELGKRKGFDHCFGEDFGPWVERKTKGSRETSPARDFCNTSWFVGPLGKHRPFATHEALLRFETAAAAETETRIAKRRNTMEHLDNSTSESPHGQSEGGAATAARPKLSERAAEVKEKAADFGRKTVDNIDESRKSTAGALDQTAAKLNSGGDRLSGVAHTAADQMSGVAHGAADKLQAAADYIRETDLKAMREDLKDIVKRYPGAALAAAAVLGFIVARGFRRG
jgi:hypothetical protein